MQTTLQDATTKELWLLQHQAKPGARKGGPKDVAAEGVLTAGLAAPLDREFTELQDGALLGVMEKTQAGKKQERRITKAATTLQSTAAMWLCRRRYLRHLQSLKEQVAAVHARRSLGASLAIQRMVRGLLCRFKYARARKAEQERKAEEAKKKQSSGKKGKKGPAAAVEETAPAATPEEVALKENLNFCHATKALLAGKLDDALALYEGQQKAKPEPVTAAMCEWVRRRRDGLPLKGPLPGQAAAASNTTPAPGKGAKKK